ncbi:MAG: hypothetical protein ACRYHA_25075 [Janthinobacterium lividum]
MVDEPATRRMGFLPQRQRLVLDEPARSREPARPARLSAIGHRFVFEGWETFDGRYRTFVYSNRKND